MSNEVYNTIQNEIESLGFRVVSKDFERPWGAFLVIYEDQAQAFSNQFFEGIDVDHLKIEGKLSPKILIVKPEKSICEKVGIKLIDGLGDKIQSSNWLLKNN